MGDVAIPPIVGEFEVFGFGTFIGYIAQPSIQRAPASLLVWITGATGRSQMAAEIGGTELARVEINDDGTGSITVPVTAAVGGSVGTHNITLVQYIGTAGESTSTYVQYEVLQAPVLLPTPQPVDQPPDPVIAPAQSWVFQDVYTGPGSLGSYVLPVSPASMTPPHFEHSFTSRRTTGKAAGQYHIFQAGEVPKEWTFGGYCPTEEMAEMLWSFRYLKRRIYVIDHHRRAWKVAITGLDIKPRLRHWFDGEESDWGSDWEMTVTVLDQEPATI